jgi:hypothetical protein
MPRFATERAPLAIAAFGTVLRLLLAFRDPIAIDRLFMPDDAYYTLTIARSIAQGHGPSVDGVHLTNGFQPLLAFLLVPLATVRTALVIGALADGVTAWCLGRLAQRLAVNSVHGELAGIAGAAIWALSPSAIATSMNGLETSLAVAGLAGALLAFDAKKPWTGALLGLCLLARVDSAFFVIAMGAAMLVRDGPKRAAMHAGLAALVVAPWWLYSLAHFGTVIPESGAAVREQAMMYRETGMVMRDQVAWAASAVFGPPFIDLTALRHFLGATASGVGMAIGIALVAGAIHLLRKRPPAPIAVLTVHALCIFSFYALYLPATWFFRRYLVPVHLLVALLVAVRVTKHRAWLAWPAAAAISIAPFFWETPSITPDQGHHGAKGYFEPAREVLAHAPPGAVIGSLQSGALSWLASAGPAPRRIINLDGVVDGEARRALHERRLAEFARSRGMTHFADWDVNVKRFQERAGANPPTLTRIYEAEPQGTDERFVLYAVGWP